VVCLLVVLLLLLICLLTLTVLVVLRGLLVGRLRSCVHVRVFWLLEPRQYRVQVLLLLLRVDALLWVLLRLSVMVLVSVWVPMRHLMNLMLLLWCVKHFYS
jgi:hypothetical protein